MCEREQPRDNKLTGREALAGIISCGVGASLLNSPASGQSTPSRAKVTNPAIQKVVAAASEFLTALTPHLRERAVIPFDAWEERSNWHFFPTRIDSIKDAGGLL